MAEEKAKESNKKAGNSWLVILLLLVIVLAGGYLWMNNNQHKSVFGTSTKNTTPAEYKAKLQSLSQENVDLLSKAVTAAADGSSSSTVDDLKQAAYKNTEDIGAAIGVVYDSTTQDKFNTAWKVYIDQSIAYAVAAKANDQSGKDKAEQAVDSGYVRSFSDYLGKLNPKIQAITLRSGLAAQVDTTQQLINDHLAGNKEAEASDLLGAKTMNKTIFGYLADGVTAQHADKFKQ